MSVPSWGSWSFDPLVWLAVLAAGLFYASMLRRVRRRTGRPVGPSRWLFYWTGLAIVFLALESPLDAIGDHYLLWAHMFQHTLLADIAPPLLILGLRAPVLPLGVPRPVLRRTARKGALGRLWATATSPWVALPAWALATWLWALPAVFDFTARHELLHDFEHLTLFYTGFALWWLVISPLPSDRRRPGMARLGYLAFSRGATAFVCLPLTWLGTTLYPLYSGGAQAYGLSALTDQRLAGATMCLLELLVFGIGMAAVFMDILGQDERAQAVAERAADGPSVAGVASAAGVAGVASAAR